MNQLLLIIDAQQALMDGTAQESAVFNKEKLIKNINAVIEKARTSNVPIVFVRDLDVAEGRGNGFQIHNEINVPASAKIFDKVATNSFYGTGLLNDIQSQQIEHVVVMGCKTEHCIDSAVRTATINGLDVTLVGDGHTTTDTDVLRADQIINHHNLTLHGHYNVEHFSVVRNAKEDLFCPTHDSYR
ncbi:isochorismatase family protein [Virgibacillus sp. 179-BFC.A HS]|uniref:Isochorismatase family protein n=1 Tax=Tigheibacillus jepli TaxID=3035914 RepID=A0ABU5CKE2_9BACI|nr:isochorismatase family protein [Virgibacillus sp. 179-BFC.A HS]MDY0406779.1 isochorismatase family protein [Virgibacillus sp. 179-BFC.A HS]